jgi:hypothetical protein
MINLQEYTEKKQKMLGWVIKRHFLQNVTSQSNYENTCFAGKAAMLFSGVKEPGSLKIIGLPADNKVQPKAI